MTRSNDIHPPRSSRLPLTLLVATAVLWESSTLYLVVPLASQLTDQLDLTRQSLSMLQGAHVVGTLASSLLAPPLVHRVGARATFVGGMVGFAVALALWPVAGTAALFTLLRFCSGTAGGVVWIAGVVWLGEVRSPDEVGKTSGFVMAYTLLGSAAGPLLGTVALRTGLGAVCWAMAGVALATAGVGVLRKPAVRRIALELDRRSSIKGWLGFALVTIPLLVTCVAAGARFSLLPLDLQRSGMSPSNIGLTFGAAGLAMAVIAIPVGRAVDRFGERRVLALSLGTLALSALTLAGPIPLVVMAAAGIVLSASLQVAWTPPLAMASRESARHGLSHGSGIATLNVVWTVGVLGGTALLAAAGSGTAGFWVGVGALCATMLAVLSRLPIGRPVDAAPTVPHMGVLARPRPVAAAPSPRIRPGCGLPDCSPPGVHPARSSIREKSTSTCCSLQVKKENSMSTNKPDSPPTAVIVGGAGAMGRWAVRAIARLGSIERLLIADIDIARAEQVAAEVGGPCVAVRLDATDGAAMRAVFGECDVVLNTMGPFSLFARPILEAAIDSDCHYLDIDDDWESTVEAFDLHERARERGLVVVKGIGGSPGISNLAALVAARRLDSVDTIITGWSMAGATLEDEPDYPATGGAGAAVEHWLIQISGTIRAWREGGELDIAPLDPVEVDYPGLGRVRARTVGHPEALTLPRYIPGLSTSLNVTSGPDWLFDHARSVAAAYDAGDVTLAEGAHQLENPPRPAERAPRDPLGQVWTMAIGTRDGRRTTVTVQPTAMPAGKMGGGTGVALAVGLELLCRGLIKETGVHAPEGAIEPNDFFPVFAEFAEPPTAGADLLLVQELIEPTPASLPALPAKA